MITNDKIKTWKRNGFKLELFDQHTRDAYGKSKLGYRLYDRRVLVFEGDDFYASPMYAIDSLEAVYALIGFLSLRKGDTNNEYFAHYTPQQIEWRDSARCEELSYMIPDKYR